MADGIQIDINAAWKGDAAVSAATSSLSKLAQMNNAHIASYANASKEIAGLNQQYNNQANAVKGTTSGISMLSGAYRFLMGSVLTAGAVKFAKQTYELARMGTEVRIDLPHPTAGVVPLVANPIKLSATPPRYEHPRPTLGQHTADILLECGFDDAEIARLKSLGAV